MSILIAILGAIVAFFIVVVVHEWGHFAVARSLGIAVVRFSIGFGKPVWSRRLKSGVEIAVGWLPLGGYVKMVDTQDEEAKKEPASKGIPFETAPWWHRALVLIAGPLMNFILAIIVFSLVYTIGVKDIKPIVGKVIPHSVMAEAGVRPQDQFTQVDHKKTGDWQTVMMRLIVHLGAKEPVPVVVKRGSHASVVPLRVDLSHLQLDPMNANLLQGFGITPYFPPVPAVVFKIMPDSPASHVDLKPGDKILSIAGKPIHSWQDLLEKVSASPGKKVVLRTPRKRVTITLGEKNGRGYLGAMAKTVPIPQSLQSVTRYPWYTAPYHSLRLTGEFIDFHLVLIKLLCTGKLSLKALSGPVSIFQSAGEASLAGLISFLQFIALISVILGVFNLLPIPALDGGYLLFCVIEGIIRRPIPHHLLMRFTGAGIIFLITLIVYATFNDVLRALH